MEEERSDKPYVKQGTWDDPYLLFNKYGRSMGQMIGESIYF